MISPNTLSALVYNVIHNYRDFGWEPIYLSLLRAGRPSAFTNEDLSILKEIIGENTFLYLDQMQQKLSYVWEVVVSIIPISRALPIHHCLAQAHVMWLFLETFRFSPNYAKDCKLSNLPPKCFPLELLTWNFTSLIHIDPEKPNELSKCGVQCSQMSCQPGFSSTGHSAQGTTLPKILCVLHEGGFAAYVAASRATSWRGLAIFQPVTLDDLNHRLPSDLVQEENIMKSWSTTP